MLALTIETTADDVALILSEGETVIGAHYGRSSRRLDSEIFPALAGTLAETGHRLDQVERLIVGRGPGSFVGTRIGMAVANSLAMVLPAPIVGVDVFAALADIAAAQGHSDFLTAINCVREEVFYQAFAARGGAPAPQGIIDVAGFAAFQDIAAGRPVVFRATKLNRTLERDRIAALPGVLVPAFEDYVAALLARGLKAEPTGESAAFELPMPVYVTAGTRQGWQP